MYDPTKDRDLIKMIGDRLVKIDPECDPEPWVDDNPAWCLVVAGDADAVPIDEDSVDVTFDIAPSEVFDGSDEGFNIGWIATRPGGAILAQCMPYNYYTDRVWTRDRDELWERAEGTLEALEEWVATKGWED